MSKNVAYKVALILSIPLSAAAGALAAKRFTPIEPLATAPAAGPDGELMEKNRREWEQAANRACLETIRRHLREWKEEDARKKKPWFSL